MPTERDYIIGALMGEAATESDRGMAAVAEVLLNRARSVNPTVYGTPGGGGAANTVQGQLFAKSGGNVQFSSASREQARKEGSEAPYHRLMNAIFAPSRLSDTDKITYDRAAAIADAFTDPNSAQYGMYNGISRGADFFDTGGGSWAGSQPWGQTEGGNVFKEGAHTFRSQNPLAQEWVPPPNYTSGPLMETPSGGDIWSSINKMSPGLKPFSGEQISMMDLEELRLRNTDPTNAALQEGGQYDRSPPPVGSMGFDEYGRTIWNNYVQDDAGSWVAPGQAGAFGDNAVDAYGRQVWKGLVQDDHGNWVTPSSAGALDTGSFDVNGRQVWHGYVQGNDGGWYLPGTAGAYAAGALDSGGRQIYDGYVQDDAGSWVRPGTAGALAPATPALPDGSLDGLGRTIYGGYVEQSPNVWVLPAPGGGPPPAAPTTGYDPTTGAVIGAQPGIPGPSASTLNGFDTPLSPINNGFNTVPDVSTNPAATASTITGFNDPGGTLYNSPPPVVPSFTDPSVNFPGYPYGPGSPGGSNTGGGGIYNPAGTANPYPIDVNNPGTGGGGSISIRPAYPGEFNW